jgi:phenylpropionate dioxygenase-like ring-hydroxylating dioxygenase large terminal subunit
MQRIRQKSWLYVAHESEIPNPGDFKSLTLAQQPIIVVRDDEGRVRVLFNICRHRKVTVCQQEKGNTTYFTCVDHGWVYNTKGNLVGLSGPNRSLRSFTERRGLISVPRMDIYRGVIFASLSPEGESLEEYLGESRFFTRRSDTKRKG